MTSECIRACRWENSEFATVIFRSCSTARPPAIVRNPKDAGGRVGIC